MRLGCTALSSAGRVCVPIDLEKLEDFDPFTVPTIRYDNCSVGHTSVDFDDLLRP